MVPRENDPITECIQMWDKYPRKTHPVLIKRHLTLIIPLSIQITGVHNLQTPSRLALEFYLKVPEIRSSRSKRYLKQIRSSPVWTEWNGRSLRQMSLACQSAPLERAERQTMSGWHTSDIYTLILSSRSDSLSHSCQNHIRKFPNKAEEPVRIWMIFCYAQTNAQM